MGSERIKFYYPLSLNRFLWPNFSHPLIFPMAPGLSKLDFKSLPKERNTLFAVILGFVDRWSSPIRSVGLFFLLVPTLPAADLFWATNTGSWDTNSTNWTTTAVQTPTTTFSSNDDVTFWTNSTSSVSSSLTAGSVTVSNTIGTLVVLNGAGTITAASFNVAAAGNLIVSNALSVSGDFTNSGTGSVTLSGNNLIGGTFWQLGSGTLLISGTNNISGGYNEFNAGTVLVTGVITNTSYIGLGDPGTNASLVISNGGSVTVTNNGLQIGNDEGNVSPSSSNTVIVTGAGSTLSAYGSGYGIWLGVDTNAGGNRLVVTNQGVVIADAIGLGLAVGSSSNSVIVTGSGSSLTATNQIDIGQALSSGNSLTVSSNAVVSTYDLWVGANGGSSNSASSSNSALVSSGASLNVSNVLYVGDGSSGNTLTISGGGTVSAGGTVIGTGDTNTVTPGSNNAVLVTGAGSLLTNSGSITIGDTGSGTLTVASNATVAASGIYIANSTNSAGTLNVGSYNGNDTGVSLTASSITFGTNGGTAILNFNQAGTTTIAATISGNGLLNQLGSGTTILTGYLTYNGGTFITNGTLQYGDGTTNTNSGYISSIGNGAITNNGTLAFDQYNSLLVTNLISGGGKLVQGSVGSTTLTANNSYTGGTLITNGFLQVGTNGTTGGIGSGTVTSANFATLIYDRSDNTTFSNVLAGEGNLTLAGSGTTTFSAKSSFDGYVAIDAGSAIISGSMSTNPAVADNLRFVVGHSTNSGTLLAFTGSTNTNNATGMQVGFTNTSSSNTAIVNGATLNLLQALGVGVSSNSASPGNQLIITNGGTVVTGDGGSNQGNVDVGGATNGALANNNSILITGSGSSLTINAPLDGINTGLIIGGAGASNNSVIVSNGAVLNDFGNLVIGDNFGSNNLLLVTGTNSALTNSSGSISVGGINGGSGSLTVAKGGSISAQTINLAP